MSRPVIVCVESDPTTRAQVEHELAKRYGADYELRFATTGAAAIAMVDTATAEALELALVIADEALADATGIDVLTRVGAASPRTRRALLVEAGVRPVQPSVLSAATLGAIHGWLVRPTAPGLVEEFHHSVTEALYDWSNANRPFEWVRLVGGARSRRTHEIRDILARNRVPFGFYDVASTEGRRVLEELGEHGGKLPVIGIGDGQVLVEPSVRALANALGGDTQPRSERYDLVVVGAGPSGLAAAVYAASEGLHTLVLECEAIGGQAGTSSSIRNYLGFPLGIGGSELVPSIKRFCSVPSSSS